MHSACSVWFDTLSYGTPRNGGAALRRAANMGTTATGAALEDRVGEAGQPITRMRRRGGSGRTEASGAGSLDAQLGMDRRVVPDVVLDGLLGRGMAGRVYTGIGPDGRREVVKIVDAHYLAVERRRRDYEHALARVARRTSAGLVDVRRWGRALGGSLFVAMPYHEGVRDLRRLERDERAARDRIAGMTVTRAGHLGRQLLTGLVTLHGLGLVHRDLKPSNCIVWSDAGATGSAERLAIIDFSAAIDLTTDEAKGGLTRLDARESIGTPAYMAPERTANVVGYTSDLYAAGILLWELLAGELPFRARRRRALMLEHRHTPVPSLESRLGEAGRRLDGFFRRALAKHPGRRFSDAREMRSAFELATESARARPA